MVQTKHVQHRLQLSGLHCASCVKTIETALAREPGVQDVSVNFADQSAVVTSAPDLEVGNLIKAVHKAGYGASIVSAGQAENHLPPQQHVKQQAVKTLVALIAGVILVLINLFDWLPSLYTGADELVNVAVLLAALAVMAYSGGHYFINAVKALRRKTATMDTLIALGTGAAWGYSAIVILAPQVLPELAEGLYLDVAVVVIALVNLGKLLEMRARQNTSGAIEKLMNLQPRMVRVLRNDEEVLIRASELQVGDLVRLRPGERVPVDSSVIEGKSYIDEAMLTGEAIPQEKQAGDTVIGGTVNQSGSLLLRAERIGKDTVLAQIITMIQKAQNGKPKLAKLADQVAAIFVPTVILIAAVTAVLWGLLGPEPKLAYMLFTGMAVLVIACPCALGLAVPIAVIAGVGKAAEYGVLIRNVDALQRIQKINTVILDKTGTITQGKPVLAKILTVDGQDEAGVLALAASLERLSEHPFAAPLVAAAAARHLNTSAVLDFSAKAGFGVSGVVDGKKLLVGNREWMNEHGVTLDMMQEQDSVISNEGATCNYIAIDQKLAAVLVVTDPVKADSKAAISQLQRRGLKIVMVTGDDKVTARAVADQVGIQEVYANQLPQHKAELIAGLQKQGAKVLMVGDGINDAPALAQADVSLAMGSGTDIAIDSADGVIMRSSLTGVNDAIIIANATLKNMKQNLFGAFIYNIIAIPVAAGILFPFTGWLLNPMLGGLTMALSSVTVVLNANRLRLLKLS